MEWNKKTLRNIFLGIAGCIFFYWLLHETHRIKAVFNTVWTVLSPFVIGATLAFILNVPMRAIERGLKFIKHAKLRRAVAIVLSLLAVVLVLTGVFYLLIPQIIATIESLVATLPDFFARCQEQIMKFLEEHPDVMTWLTNNTDFESLDWQGLIEKAVALITDSLSAIVDKVIDMIVGLSTGIFNAVLSLVFGIYCLSRKEILARQGRRILYSVVPEKVGDEVVRILRMTNSTFSNFISGQCLEAVILGCLFAIAMLIFDMPYIPLVSVIISVTALVPIVGAFIGCVLGAFFILVQDPVLAVGFVVMFLILQQLENNLIYPRVVGTSIGLPGMWVLVAVAIGGDLMGVGGMLLMIPLASVMYALAREFTDKRLAAKGVPAEKLQDHPPILKSGFKESADRQKKKKELKKQQKNAAKQKDNE